jgi:hypothetical protein
VLQATDCGAPRICLPWMIGAPAAAYHYARSDPRPPSAARSKSADVPGLIRVSVARSESARPDPSPCLQCPSLASPILLYVPAMIATGRRFTTLRGSEATGPSLGADGGAGAGGALPHPRGPSLIIELIHVKRWTGPSLHAGTDAGKTFRADLSCVQPSSC